MLNVGDVIWIKLSESDYFLTADRGGKDPIEELFQEYSKRKQEKVRVTEERQKQERLRKEVIFKKFIEQGEAPPDQMNDRDFEDSSRVSLHQ